MWCVVACYVIEMGWDLGVVVVCYVIEMGWDLGVMCYSLLWYINGLRYGRDVLLSVMLYKWAEIWAWCNRCGCTTTSLGLLISTLLFSRHHTNQGSLASSSPWPSPATGSKTSFSSCRPSTTGNDIHFYRMYFSWKNQARLLMINLVRDVC